MLATLRILGLLSLGQTRRLDASLLPKWALVLLPLKVAGGDISITLERTLAGHSPAAVEEEGGWRRERQAGMMMLQLLMATGSDVAHDSLGCYDDGQGYPDDDDDDDDDYYPSCTHVTRMQL